MSATRPALGRTAAALPTPTPLHGRRSALALGLAAAIGGIAVAVPADCGDPDAGSCFVWNSAPGCDDAACCTAVCAFDAFCCTVTWDGLCAAEAGGVCAVRAYTDGVIDPRSGHRHRLITPGTWQVTRDFAVAEGENLVTIDGGQQNTWLRDSFLGKLDGFSRSAWIGLSDASLEGHFTWQSGAPLVYSNWMPGEPNDQNGEDHVLMLDGVGRWNDASGATIVWAITERSEPVCGAGTGSCFSTHGPGCAIESCCHAVCEADPYCCETAWDSACVTAADWGCAPEVVVGPIYNPGTGHRYYLLDYTCWSEGEKKAMELLGNLATIQGSAENEWVRRNLLSPDGLDRSAFIGLHDQAFEGTFAWTTHADPTYFNWAVGEPSDAGSDDHVLMLANGAWRDVANTAIGHFAIVEVPCVGDVDSSGIVDGEDLGAVLAAWGTTADHADLDKDGIVGGSDLGFVLASWGYCGTSTCCTPSGGAGCDQPGCQSCVCEIDGFCCAVQWDQICAGEASDECYAVCQCLVIE